MDSQAHNNSNLNNSLALVELETSICHIILLHDHVSRLHASLLHCLWLIQLHQGSTVKASGAGCIFLVKIDPTGKFFSKSLVMPIQVGYFVCWKDLAKDFCQPAQPHFPVLLQNSQVPISD